MNELSVVRDMDLARLREESSFLATSSLLPQHLRGRPADVAITIQYGRELGFSPMQAIQSITVIQGTPTVKPEAQLALFYTHLPEGRMEIEVDAIKQMVTVTAARNKTDKPFVTTWTMERAKQLGLAGKDNYLKQPLVMMRWRAVGEALRTVAPDVTRGMYNAVEAEYERPIKDVSSEKVEQLEKMLGIEVTPPPAREMEVVPEEPKPAPVVKPLSPTKQLTARILAFAKEKEISEAQLAGLALAEVGKTGQDMTDAELKQFYDFLVSKFSGPHT